MKKHAIVVVSNNTLYGLVQEVFLFIHTIAHSFLELILSCQTLSALPSVNTLFMHTLINSIIYVLKLVTSCSTLLLSVQKKVFCVKSCDTLVVSPYPFLLQSLSVCVEISTQNFTLCWGPSITNLRDVWKLKLNPEIIWFLVVTQIHYTYMLQLCC